MNSRRKAQVANARRKATQVMEAATEIYEQTKNTPGGGRDRYMSRYSPEEIARTLNYVDTLYGSKGIHRSRLIPRSSRYSSSAPMPPVREIDDQDSVDES